MDATATEERRGQIAALVPRAPVRRYEERDGQVTLELEGEVDAASAGPLRSLLVEVLALPARSLTLSLGHVTFLDSVGISVVVAAHNRAAEAGIPFAVSSLSDTCAKVFEITGLLDVFAPR